jgi:hypothetical protein
MGLNDKRRLRLYRKHYQQLVLGIQEVDRCKSRVFRDGLQSVKL